MGDGCGRCFKLTGTGNIDGYTDTTTIILKGTNFCPDGNPHCEDGKSHFDIAAPGFDYPSASISNTCDTIYTEEDEPGMLTGDANATDYGQTCAFWMINSQDPDDTDACDCSVLNDEVLRDGCSNFKSLGWNNPEVDYEVVDCPLELSELPCWEENDWPSPSPDLCTAP